MTPADAYEAGQKAWMLGDMHLDDPFRADTELSREWQRGFEDAKKESHHGKV